MLDSRRWAEWDHSHLVPQEMPAPAPSAPSPDTRRIALALQGGGSFGAFTWGVLDRLLEEEDVVFDSVSGASAGAVNAVVMTDGLIKGGREGARAGLREFWQRASNAAPRTLVRPGARSRLVFEVSTRVVSPYQFNPLNLNPLRSLLEGLVDFERLRAEAPLPLLVATTRVGDGALRIFREQEVSIDAVLASTCLPLLQQAVSIDGEDYWDGGYAANPPLIQLVDVAQTSELLVVQIIPTTGAEHPTTSPEIARRLDQITFNSTLNSDMESLAVMHKIMQDEDNVETSQGRKLETLSVEKIAAEEWVENLPGSSVLNLDWAFLTRLHEAGRAAAASYLGRPTEPRIAST
jgi:NTE family protein